MINADDGEAGAAGAPPGQGLVIRERTEHDLGECVRLMGEVHRHDGYPMHWPADPRRWLSTPKIFAAWVATVNGQLAGHVALSVISPDDAAPRLLGLTAPGSPGSGSAAESSTGSGGTSGVAGGAGSGSSGAGSGGTGGVAGGAGSGGTGGVAGGAGSGSSGGVAGSGRAGDEGAAASGEVAMLSRLFVSVSARGYGAGRALIQQAMQSARERGQLLLLDVHSTNTSAIALYERLGWNFLGTSHAQWGADRVTLRSYTAPARGPETPTASPTPPA